ncbi:MAG: spondin domain-containing protein [Phycisphaerales bacterium]|nr:spondin domain-containing protein [Phycisphaerales bacterium]
MKTIPALFLGLSLANTSALAQDQATFEIEFIAEWSAENHPTSFPNNPHFSPLIGATHNDQITLWTPGGIATNGIEVMAETGSPTPLRNEVLSLIDFNFADQFINLGGIALSPNSRTGTIEADADFPLLSLVTMIAPSPDWFVGIHDLNLRPDGLWIDEVIIDLDPYDSGTDAGVNYTSSNSNINPHLPITNIANQFPFTGTQRIGTLRITRTSEAACSTADLALPYNELDFFDISAFLTAFSASDTSADLNNDNAFDFFDISQFLTSFSAGCP